MQIISLTGLLLLAFSMPIYVITTMQQTRYVSEAYDPSPITQQLPQSTQCIIAGCSGELCVASTNPNLTSTCDWKPEYSCFNRHGLCELQGNNECGWTNTPELLGCIAASANPTQ